MRNRDAHDRHLRRRIRLLACLAASLLLVTGVVRLWPASGPEAADEVVYTEGKAPVSLKQVAATRQGKAPPPPPPLPPVPVPDRVELKEQELDFSTASLSLEFPAEGPSASQGTADASTSPDASAPDVAARQISIVEPVYTEAAREEGIRARVVVEVVIGKDGRVEQAEIVERVLLSKEGEPVGQVTHLGYGLEAAALAAARQTIFLPARSGGRPVKSRKRITIRFGR